MFTVVLQEEFKPRMYANPLFRMLSFVYTPNMVRYLKRLPLIIGPLLLVSCISTIYYKDALQLFDHGQYPLYKVTLLGLLYLFVPLLVYPDNNHAITQDNSEPSRVRH